MRDLTLCYVSRRTVSWAWSTHRIIRNDQLWLSSLYFWGGLLYSNRYGNRAVYGSWDKNPLLTQSANPSLQGQPVFLGHSSLRWTFTFKPLLKSNLLVEASLHYCNLQPTCSAPLPLNPATSLLLFYITYDILVSYTVYFFIVFILVLSFSARG